MLTVLEHELKRLRSAPYIWLILAIGQFVLAWSFLARLETWLTQQYETVITNSQFGVTDFVLAPLFSLGLLLACFILPFLLAQSIAGEKQQLTWPLLASSPMPLYQIILGKFFAQLVFCGVLMLMILLMAIPLSMQTNIDYGQIFTNSLFFLLCCAALIMIGLFISANFSNTVAATVTTLVTFIFLFNTNWLLLDNDSTFLSYLSFKEHLLSAQKGLISSHDLIFFILFILVFYILTFVKLDKQRL